MIPNRPAASWSGQQAGDVEYEADDVDADRAGPCRPAPAVDLYGIGWSLSRVARHFAVDPVTEPFASSAEVCCCR